MSANGSNTIAFLLPSVATIGGSVRVISNVANRLVERFRIVLISRDGSTQPFFPLDGRIVVRGFDAGRGTLRSLVANAKAPLVDICREEDVDVLVGVGTYETLMAILPSRSLRIPLVFNDHGALVNQWDDKDMRAISFLDALFAAKTVVLTEQSARDYHRLLHIPARKIVVIANWIPDAIVDPSRTYDRSSKRLLWVGRLDREKGVDHLFEIARRVMPKHPDWVWDVYGNEVVGSDFDLREALEKEGLDGRVVLKGRADNMYDLYRDYALLTLTSYREGLPLVLLEGLAKGLPLVSFDVDTGPRDIIEDGVNGRLLPCYDCQAFADALDGLMDDEDLRAAMADASLLRLGAFSEDAILERWVNLFEGLTKGTR